MNNIENCFKKGLLRKTQPSKQKGTFSLEKAKDWLEEAEKNLKASAYGSCISSSYMSMFHAARAILFKDGVREKSHYCIARYLEKYVKNKQLEEKWVFLLDRIRDVRHTDQYTLQHYATEEEASSALESAETFVSRIKRLFLETQKK